MPRACVLLTGLLAVAGCTSAPPEPVAPPGPEPVAKAPPTEPAVAPPREPKFPGPRGGKNPKPPAVDPFAERAAVKYVTDLGGVTVRYENVTDWNQLGTVKFENQSVATVDAGKLAPLKALVFLGLEGSADTDALLKQLPANLPWLKKVEVNDSAATDAGYVELGKVPDLEEVYAQKAKATATGVAALAGLPKLAVVDFKGSALGDDAVKPLAASKTLKRLTLADTPVTLGGVPPGGWAALEHLDLSGAPVTDAGLKALAGAPHLAELNLTGTQVSDAGLAALSGLKALRVLKLGGTKVTGRGLDALEKLPLLDDLTLAGPQVDDAGFRRVAGLTRLKKLDLTDAAVTDAGFKPVLGLPVLEQLDVTRSGLGDPTVRDLAKMKGLKQVTFARTKVTKAGTDALRAARPDVVVTAE